MIKNIYLKNYKSFKELNFEIESYKGGSNIYLIYGENGSGKSNIISSIFLLSELTNSLVFIENFREFISEQGQGETIPFEYFNSYFNSKSINEILKKTKKIGSKEEMEMEYTFLINNKEFKYKLIFDNQKIVFESLYAPLVKNQVKVYEVDYRNNLTFDFNNNLFTKTYNSEIEDSLKQYFGKHSLLSIITLDLRNKNLEYLKENVNNNVIDLIGYIRDFSILYKEGIKQEKKVLTHHKTLFYDLERGSISVDAELKLNKNEEALDIYLKSLYSDIKNVYFKREKKDGNIEYELYLKKMIGEELTDIPFSLESRGTKKILELFPFFIKLLNGGVVVIDELESGVHDLLITLLIERLEDVEFKGQLIATTHNTMLLDVVNKNQIYILDIDDFGNKKIYNLRNSGVPIQANHSIYNNYKKGAYGGVPNTGYFDFEHINECLGEEAEWEEVMIHV